ncbi:hypothetical protein KTE71_28865 [Burkholderia multivorans]|uniref:hypothetical protein n=1 Tax=Burkholderia multivorans TaxID=87883 RepID=UPI001C2631AE|nr:hypothetical protein [Burkholderia multivorans]MBU9391508.1 hypothetical protein [Burkholderia multivorans]
MAITISVDTSNLTDGDKAVIASATVFEKYYEQTETRFLYTDEEVLLQAAAWYGNKAIIQDLLQPKHKLKVNLSFHGPEALTHVIQWAANDDEGDRTAEAIELVQLLVSHRAKITNDHLQKAVETKNVGLVQYFVAQLGLDVSVVLKYRRPGTEEIREWAREWKKVNKLKTKLSRSLNKETTHPTTTRSKI